MNNNLKDFLNSSKGKMVLGQIISMLKGIHFVQKDRTIESLERLRKQGYIKNSSFLLDITDNHWLTLTLGWKRNSCELQEFVAEKFLLYFDELNNGDRDTFCQVIKSTIQNSLLNKRIFDLDFILHEEASLSKENSSLFSILSTKNPLKSASYLFIELYIQMKNSLADWLIIYPMKNISSRSYKLEFDGISIYDPKDESFWTEICSNYKNAYLWHPSESQLLEPRNGGYKEPQYNFTTFPNSTWLICEINGTSAGARNKASIKMKMFIAVLFSHIFLYQNVLSRNSEIPERYSKQFPSNNNRTGILEENASIGEIIPPSSVEIIITEEIFNEVKAWYSKVDSLEPVMNFKKEFQ